MTFLFEANVNIGETYHIKLECYFLGLLTPRYQGDPKKAMYIYRSAYNMREVKGLTKEYLLELANRIEEDFNY